MLDKLSLFFWNTSLSPPTSKKWNKSSEDKKLAVMQFLEQIVNQEYDFICLCEVSEEDVDLIYSTLKLLPKGYGIAKGTKVSKGLYYDTCIIYKLLFECIDIENAVDGENKHKVKVYSRYIFQHNEKQDIFCLYVTHWLSMLKDNNERRRNVASYIRYNINQLKDKDPNVKFIVLGDFNSEPYDPAMVSGLRSSRHQSIVLENSHLLYNPFWKFLPCYNNNPKGSYYYNDGENHKWSILDQMLFSGNFLKSGWKIKDENIQIINIGNFMIEMGVNEFLNPSDHFPIHAILEK